MTGDHEFMAYSILQRTHPKLPWLPDSCDSTTGTQAGSCSLLLFSSNCGKFLLSVISFILLNVYDSMQSNELHRGVFTDVGYIVDFWGASILMSMATVQVYTPNQQEFLFCCILQSWLPFSCFLIAVLMEVREHFHVLMCVPLVAKNVEHLFKMLLTIWISSFEGCVFSSLVLLVTG